MSKIFSCKKEYCGGFLIRDDEDIVCILCCQEHDIHGNLKEKEFEDTKHRKVPHFNFHRGWR